MKTILLCSVLLAFQCAAAQQTTTIHGTVLDEHGMALKLAHVHIRVPSETKALTTVESEKDGLFTITTDRTGLVLVEFTAVDHALYSVPLLCERPDAIGLNVQLKPYEYVSQIGDIRVVAGEGNANPQAGEKLVKQADGTYALTVASDEKSFVYELAGLEASGRTINGQNSAGYRYDGDGDYRSVERPVRGKVHLTLDPAKLIRSDARATATFDPPDKVRAALVTIVSDMQNDKDRFIRTISEVQASGKDPREAAQAYNWSGPLRRIKDQLSTEKDPTLRQALFVSYFSIGGMKDSAIARTALSEAPAASGLWALNPGAVLGMCVAAGQDSMGDLYMDRVVEKNPEPGVRRSVLFNNLMMATYAKKTEKARALYGRLLSDFPESQEAKIARQGMSPDRAVVVGKPLPEFSVAALHDGSKNYGKGDFKGKFLLIDFWAVWCGPCVGEMATIHKAYEKFAPKGLQILSLSFDQKTAAVDDFRRDKWKMPWLHSFVEGGFDSDLAKKFEVFAIPKPILVDGNGMIVAMEGDLRGENLEKTLGKYLGE